MESWKNSKGLMSSGAGTRRLFQVQADEDASRVSNNSSHLPYHFPQTPSDANSADFNASGSFRLFYRAPRTFAKTWRKSVNETKGGDPRNLRAIGHPFSTSELEADELAAYLYSFTRLWQNRDAAPRSDIRDMSYRNIQRLQAGYMVTLVPKPSRQPLVLVGTNRNC